MECLLEKRKEIVKKLLKKNFLISKEFIDSMNNQTNFESINTLLLSQSFSEALVIDNTLQAGTQISIPDINWPQMETFRVMHEKKKDSKGYNIFKNFLVKLKEDGNTQTKQVETINTKFLSKIKIVFIYEENVKKREVSDFTTYFNHRLNTLSNILKNRPELNNLLSINRVLSKKEKDSVAIIGVVKEKEIRDTNTSIIIEDSTGEIKININKNNAELFELSKNIVHDEVIGITGLYNRNIIFANDIIWPDIPLTKELKKNNEEIYAIFLSDLHVGSKKFLPEEFNRFIKWINCEMGNPVQKEIASKVGYIFIMGDLVDGVGIYPKQESELEITNITKQYDECAKLLSMIPRHIPIIICPGNHDALRISEPQPRLSKEYAKSLWELPNVIMVTNPSIINIESTENFSGFDILMYHGYSFDYYVDNVEVIRSKGGYDRADLIMTFLLQRRHLAPSHTSTLYIPDNKDDPLLIRKVPDFFVTGHIHKSYVANYRNITLICGSCWQDKTAFQEKVGHHPEPARVPIVNLKTRKVKVLSFNIPKQNEQSEQNE